MKNKADQSDYCQITGLPIKKKLEWTNLTFDTNYYTATFSIIGKNIVLSKTYGYAAPFATKKAISFRNEIVKNNIPENLPYILIEDITDLKKASINTQKLYITYHENDTKIKAIIFYGASAFFKIMIKIGKRIGKIKFPVIIVDNYKEAILLAQQLYSQAHDTEPLTPIKKICPVSGLPITSKPEWIDIDVEKGYSVSFKLIGDNIMLITPAGDCGTTGMKALLEIYEKILKEINLSEKKRIDIWDYSMIEGIPPKQARVQFANFLINEKNKNNLLGFYGINAPLIIKFLINIGKKLYKSNFPIENSAQYKTAIKKAVKLLIKNGLSDYSIQYKKFTRDDWLINLDGIQVRFALIGNDIILHTAVGNLKEHHLSELYYLYQKVLIDSGVDPKNYYEIADWEKLGQSGWKARITFINKYKKLYEYYRCKLYIICGVSSYLNAIIKISKQFFPVELIVVKNFAEAIQIIEKRKKIQPLITKNKLNKKKFTNEEINTYCDEILQFIGKLNWDQEEIQLNKKNNINNSHPFKTVFDAISILKWDFDYIVKEKDDIVEKLKKSNQELNNITTQLIQSEKMSALGELSAGLVHELNQPLNIIKIISQSIIRDMDQNRFDPSTLNDNLNSIVTQVNNTAEIITYFRIFSRQSEGILHELFNVNAIIKDVLKFTKQQLINHSINLIYEFTDNLPKIKGNMIHLEQVFINLINNARDAVEACNNNQKFIKIKTFKIENQNKIAIEIMDNGIGIPKDLREKIFKPFFTTKEPSKGTGLGLSVSKRIIEEHNGKLEYDVINNNTIFRVILPISA